VSVELQPVGPGPGPSEALIGTRAQRGPVAVPTAQWPVQAASVHVLETFHHPPRAQIDMLKIHTIRLRQGDGHTERASMRCTAVEEDKMGRRPPDGNAAANADGHKAMKDQPAMPAKCTYTRSRTGRPPSIDPVQN